MYLFVLLVREGGQDSFETRILARFLARFFARMHHRETHRCEARETHICDARRSSSFPCHTVYLFS
jgi:hypothetical protein